MAITTNGLMGNRFHFLPRLQEPPAVTKFACDFWKEMLEGSEAIGRIPFGISLSKDVFQPLACGDIKVIPVMWERT